MSKSVTSMEEIIAGIEEGVRSANLPSDDGQIPPYMDGNQIADVIQTSTYDKFLEVLSQS